MKQGEVIVIEHTINSSGLYIINLLNARKYVLSSVDTGNRWADPRMIPKKFSVQQELPDSFIDKLVGLGYVWKAARKAKFKDGYSFSTK